MNWFSKTVLLVIVASLFSASPLLAAGAPSKLVPASILRQMPPDANSIYFQRVDIGPGIDTVYCHLYKIGKMYVFDVFRPSGNNSYRRLSSSPLGDTPHSTTLDISFRWLQPKRYQGIVLLLHDRDMPGRWDGSYDLIIFPDGFGGRTVHQSFTEVFLGSMSISSTFDSYDARGLLVVSDWWIHEGRGNRGYSFWNGQGFVKGEPRSRYAIISPLFKTAGQARHFLNLSIPRMQIVEMLFAPPVSKAPLIQPTRYYMKKGLKIGYYVAVLEYDDLPSNAEIIAKELQKRGVTCSVLRIY